MTMLRFFFALFLFPALMIFVGCATVEEAVEEEIDERVRENVNEGVEKAADSIEGGIENAVNCAVGDTECIEEAQENGETVVLTGEEGGDRGGDIKWLQMTLNDLGHNCGPEDGVMGPKTRSCILSFQKENDLKVTGEVNEATHQEIVDELSQNRVLPSDTRNDVKWLQITLNNLGHACGPEDGIMGPKTRACIRSFQKANDLEVTGEVNEATYQKMLEKEQ